MRERSLIDEAGVSIPYGRQTWRTFVADGGLGRTLVRMCALAEGSVRLSFVIDRAMAAGVEVRFSLDDERVTVRSEAVALDEDALEPLSALLRQLNEALAARGTNWRFIVGSGTGEGGTNFGYRLAMLSAAAAAEVAAEDWVPRECLPDEAPAPGELPSSPSSPSRPASRLRTVEEVVGEGAWFDEDPGYPALLAAYVERLAGFAGAGKVRCRPSPSLADLFTGDAFFSLELTWTYPGGGTLQETVRIRRQPAPDLQPIFDRINGWLDSANEEDAPPPSGRRRLYRSTRRPWGEQAVLATDAEAAELRRGGYIIERELPEQARQRLAVSGFELPSFWPEWGDVHGQGARAEGLRTCLVRTVALARERFSPALAIELDGDQDGDQDGDHDGRPRVTFSDGGYAHTWAWEGAASRPALEVLAALYGALNGFAAARGSDQRFVIMTIEPYAPSPRLLMLGPAWQAAVLRERGLVRGCLDPASEAEVWATVPEPRAHPPLDIHEELALLPLPEKIVGKQYVQSSDYKCAARESDLPSVFDEIAAFARVPATCAPLARRDPTRDEYELTASWQGAESVIRMSGDKYADVQPILDYLNAILAAGGAGRGDHRLYRFQDGRYDSGVLLATDQQAAELRALAYLVEPR